MFLPFPDRAALAQTDDTARYIQARDRAIEELKGPYDALTAEFEKFQRGKKMSVVQAYWNAHIAPIQRQQAKDFISIEPLLRKAVGKFDRAGFDTHGKMNLESLFPEGDFGRLDGIEYSSRDGQTKILLSSRALVSDWLRKFYEPPTGAVPSFPGVLSMEAQPFMTQAWAIEDKHFTLLNRLPVVEPKGTAVAVAFLGELSADDGNYVPDIILAELVTGNRVYLASQPLVARLPTLDACDRQWQKLSDLRKDDEAASAFDQCYANGVTAKPAYSAAVVQAQQLTNNLGR